MSDIFKKNRSYSADLVQAYQNSANLEELASAVQQIMARFISDTENQFYALENSRIIIKQRMKQSALSECPTRQLVKWLDTVRPALKELGETIQKRIEQMTHLITKIISLLQVVPDGQPERLTGLFQSQVQLEELALQARDRYAAWLPLLETIQEAVGVRLTAAALPRRNLRSLRFEDVLRAAEAVIQNP